MEGGCACGAVRYRLDGEPFDTSWCHCRNCQRISGAPAAVYTSVPRTDFVILSGQDIIGRVALTDFAERQFCGRCGSPLATELDTQPDSVDVIVASLDEPDVLQPEFHIFYGSKVGWFETNDDLPRYQRNRRDG